MASKWNNALPKLSNDYISKAHIDEINKILDQYYSNPNKTSKDQKKLDLKNKIKTYHESEIKNPIPQNRKWVHDFITSNILPTQELGKDLSQ